MVAAVLLTVATLIGEVPAHAARSVVVDLADSSQSLRLDASTGSERPGADIAACDLNDDGLLDLAISDHRSNGPSGTKTYCGEVSLLFGQRRAWKGQFTIAQIRSTRIVGQDPFDELGLRISCGDLNADGVADLVLGAWNADGPFNNLLTAGQVHLVQGRSSFPAVIDLVTDPGVIVYGSRAGERLGTNPEVGDVNGDGTSDLLIDAQDAFKPGGGFAVGAVYALFGRLDWPPTLDVASAANVTIYGRSGDTDFPSKIVAADLNGDGTDDLAAAARRGDTPVSGRQDAGDLFLLRGRTNWPTSIDLQTQAPDCRLYGADPFDYIGHVDQLATGDIDSDNTTDLVIGVRAGDGRNNNETSKGELRLIAPDATWPATWDLRTNTKQIVYGQRPGDRLGTMMSVADVNGDGTDDLVSAMIEDDHVDGSRIDAGGAVVVLGRSPFPLDVDMALAQEDWRIVGANLNDRSAFRGVSDINDDRIFEIVVANVDALTSVTRSVWIVSPVDIDGDGHTQLDDVCPLVSDPLQTDSDADGRGDACLLDWDGDGDPDTTDCKSNSAKQGKPSEIDGVTLHGGATTIVSWNDLAVVDRYDVFRGLTSTLAAGDYGNCQNSRDADTSDTQFEEPQIPPTGSSYFFLVRGFDSGCGGIGTLGARSDGTPRVLTATCP
jgi:hypothetical protein